jgi:hypothetical protein
MWSRSLIFLPALWETGEPMNVNVADAKILSQEERLEALLHRRLGNRIRDLRIRLQPEGVTLHGRTATYHAKQLAQHAAMELGNLPILANDIEVC